VKKIKFAALVVAFTLLTSVTMGFAAMPVQASTARAPFAIHQYAYLDDTPDIYWVGVSNRTDGTLNSYKFVAPKDMTIRLKPARWHHSFNIWKDGEKIAMPARSAERNLELSMGDEISLEITLYYPEGGGNWARSSLPRAATAENFETWYTGLGGTVAYAGGYATIPKWNEVSTVRVAGLDASLVTLAGGEKAIRFTADREMTVTRLATTTEINVWRAPSTGDWTALPVGRAFSLSRGDVLVFEIKSWEKAVICGDVVILTR